MYAMPSSTQMDVTWCAKPKLKRRESQVERKLITENSMRSSERERERERDLERKIRLNKNND